MTKIVECSCCFSTQHGWERIEPHCHQRNLTVIENSMIWCAMFVQSMMLKLQLILMKSRKSDLRNSLVLCNRYMAVKNDCFKALRSHGLCSAI